jgi:hypothetical protein
MNHYPALQILVDAFRPRDWNDRSLATYNAALSDMTVTEVRKRVFELLNTAKYMPSIAEIRGINSDLYTPDDIIYFAGLILRQPTTHGLDAPTFDYVNKIIERLGGWEEFRKSPDPKHAPAIWVNGYRKQVAQVMELPESSRTALELESSEQ